ncbi:hypothetical protein ABK040_000911 [Willaertia magna]
MAFLGAHNNDPMQLDNLDEEKELTITKINFPKQQEYNNNKQNNNLFSQLPDEIIQFHIIPLLDVLSLGFSFLPLNKKYFHLADSNEIWRERFFRALPKSQHEAFKKNAVLWRYAYSSELLAQATSSSSGSSSNHAGVLSEDEMVDSGKNGNNNSGIGVNSSGNGSNDVIYNEQAINFKELYKTLFVQGRFAGHRFLNSGNYKRDQYSHHITYFYLIDLFKNNYSENSSSSSLSQQNTAIGPSNSQQSSLQQLSRFSTLTTNNNTKNNNNFNQNHNNANNFLLDNYKCIDMIFNQTIWPSIELFKGRTRERTALEDEESKEYYAVNGIVMGMYFVMFQEWMSNDLRAHVIGRKLVYKKNNTTINNNNRNNLIRNVNVLDDIGIDQNKKDDISVVIHGVWSDNKERCGLFTSENVDWNTTNFDLTILGTKLHDINYKRLYDLENEIKMFSKLTAFRNWQMTTFTKYNNNNQSTSLFDNYYNNNNQHNQQPFIVKNEYQVTFDCDTYMRGEAILKNSTIISQSNVSSSNNMNQQQQQNNQQQQGQHFQIIGNVLDNYVSFNLLNRGEHLFLAWCEFDNATNTTATNNNNHLFNTSTTRSSFNNGFDEKGNNEFSRLSVNANRLMELTTIPTIPLTGMPSTSANLGGPSSLMMNGGAPSSSHGRYSSLSLRRSSVASIGSSSSSSNNNTFNGGSKLLRRKSCFGKSNNNLNENVAIQPKDCKLSGFLMDRNGIKGYLVLEPVSSIVTLNNNSNNVTTIHSLP